MPRAYDAALSASQARLRKLTFTGAVRPLKRLYDEAQAVLAARLRKTIRSGRKDTMTAYQQHLLLAQVRVGQMHIAGRLAGKLGEATQHVQRTAVKDAAEHLARLEKHFTGADLVLPVQEAARFIGIPDKRAKSLLRIHETSMAQYGARTVRKIEERLAISLMTGETPLEAIDAVQQTADVEWWQGERIVRTETAWAYNAAHRDTYEEAAEDLDDLMMRWSEHVDDLSYEPEDDRVGKDSIALHGQVAGPDGLFTMPPDPDVSPSLWNRSWEFPPNRPNDRAVLQPWRHDWDVPGWQFLNGRIVDL